MKANSALTTTKFWALSLSDLALNLIKSIFGSWNSPASQYLVVQEMQLAADAIAMRITDAHMEGGAAQMEPREVTAKGHLCF